MHESVCLRASLDGLAIKSNGHYIDATFGRGGHTDAILSSLDAAGRLYAFDCDPEAAVVASSMEEKDFRLKFFKHNYSNIPQEMEKENLVGQVNGVIFDLGVSSPQIDTPERGFSFRFDGPLDMRMDPSQGWPASHFLATASQKEIAHIIKTFGEEKFAVKIAKAIVTRRLEKPIETTKELSDLIVDIMPNYEAGKHPATRTFQAIRMHVNNELQHLEQALNAIVPVVATNGRIVILSYHSLEHMCVKSFYKKFGPGNQNPKELKYDKTKTTKIKRIGKAMRPDFVELSKNRRARSAYLRVFEKL